jgi:hypothetical protein
MYTPTLDLAPASQLTLHWPWIAVASVTLLLIVIGRFSRRHSQFGGRI